VIPVPTISQEYNFADIEGIIDPDLALEIVRESSVIAFDTETTGLERKDMVCGWVITDESNSIYVPVRHEGGGNIPDGASWERELAKAFADRGRRKLRTVGHHLGFDLRMALKHDVVLYPELEDTMINESLIYDLTHGYGLDDLSVRYKVRVKKGDALYAAIAARFGGLPDRKSMKNFWRMPGDQFEVVDYATGDGFSTLDVWEKQQPLLDQWELRKPWKLECDLLPYLARMHHRGVKIDANYAERVGQEIKTNIETAMAAFPPGFNPRSPKEVEKLFRANGYTDDMFAKSATGLFSFTAKWLENQPIGKGIIGVRQLEKARDSFIAPLVDTHNVDGRVHPVLHQSKSDEYGVAGARLSCSDPNLQAFPKRNFLVGSTVRPLVIADGDWLIEEGDFMQQEPRLFTHYSQEPILLEGYRSGTMDIHDAASQILNLDREYAKRLGLGMLTMMSPKTLAVHMEYTIDEAKRDHRAFLGGFAHIKKFQDLAQAVMLERGYVRSILGRVAHHSGPNWAAYKAVSRIIQNGGGDHMKTALLRANQYEDAYPEYIQILLTIHDSTIWQRDPGHDITELVRAIEGVAQEPDFNLSVPIPIELGSGHNWAQASYKEKVGGRELKGKRGWVAAAA
jgi:DNA polymerase-1